ncbi:MAG: hypothetical protein RL264_553 [Bacteroidota bacterium]|jgi:sec-independent protein translocase protein TatA
MIPLFLSDVSGSEIFLIMMVVLMFFGSKSIPGIAKSLGKALYEFRNATSEIQNEIKKSGVDIKKDLNLQNLIDDKANEIVQPLDQVFTEIDNTVHYSGSSVNVAPKVTETEIPPVETTLTSTEALPELEEKISTETNSPKNDEI